jgi:arylsulfatase A-like enzyme
MSSTRVGGFCLACLMAVSASSCPAATQPDIVVVMVDDLDVATFDVALELGLLPAIDESMIHGGMRFDESFVTDALCCPSRATFMTGQYPHNHGVRRGQPAPDGSFSAFDDSHTVATALSAAGYRTGLVGKFLNGYGYSTPLNHPECATPACWMRYVPPGWSDWQGTTDYGELNGLPGYAGTYCMYNYTVNDGGRLVTYGTGSADYQTDVLAWRGAAIIDDVAQGNAPLFLVASPLAPHYELCLPLDDPFAYDLRPAPRHAGSLPPWVNLDFGKPSFNEVDVSDKPGWFADRYTSIDIRQQAALNRQFRHRLEALRAVDDLFASLRQRLLVAGRWENAYVIFTSDNGWLYGEHRVSGKVMAWEESIRVPLLLRGPGVPAGERREAMVINNDLAPTILELAGAVAELPADGRSLVPLFAQDLPPAWRRRFLIEHFRDTPPAPVDYLDFLAVRTAAGDFGDSGQRTLIDWRVDWLRNPTRAGIEHYDLAADPHQLDSLDISDGGHAAQLAALRAGIAVLRECGKADRMSCLDAERVREHLFHGGFDG